MIFLNSVKKYSISLFAVTTLIISSSFVSNQNNSASSLSKIKIICIDAGHGGHDAGALGRRSKEKDINLEVALKLGKKIESELPDVKVIYTRKTDIFLPLYERPKVANKNSADLFISIHCNSANSANRRNPSVRGTETFLLGFNSSGQQESAIRENASILLEDNYQSNYDGFDPKDPSSYIVFKLLKRQYRTKSIRLASMIQTEFAKTNRPNRGVKEEPFAVLKTAAMPAVLTELGFMSSPEEEDYMLSDSGQNEIIGNILTAIKKFKTTSEKINN